MVDRRNNKTEKPNSKRINTKNRNKRGESTHTVYTFYKLKIKYSPNKQNANYLQQQNRLRKIINSFSIRHKRRFVHFVYFKWKWFYGLLTEWKLAMEQQVWLCERGNGWEWMDRTAWEGGREKENVERWKSERAEKWVSTEHFPFSYIKHMQPFFGALFTRLFYILRVLNTLFSTIVCRHVCACVYLCVRIYCTC